MSYQVGGLIEASDYNNIIINGIGPIPPNPPTPAVNTIWSTGTGDSGYGQPQLTSALNGSIVNATKWNALITAILGSANHQGTTLTPFNNPNPVQGEIVEWEAVMYSNIRSIYNSRLNAQLQGPVTDTQIVNTGISWNNNLTMVWTLVWPGDNQARYYFNAGGQIGLTFQHPDMSSTINLSFRRIAATFGTVWISSPSSGTVTLMGTSYSGVTQIGGVITDTELSPNLGFYGLTTSDQIQATHRDTNVSEYYYTNSYMTISSKYNGAGVMTVTAQWVAVPAGGAVVAPGSIGYLLVRPPAIVFLSNTWNGPTITTSYSGS